MPYSGAIEVEFKTKEIKNSTIYIKGVKEGSVFRVNENIYVVGGDGVVTISDFGIVKIISPDKVCELNLTEDVSVYHCD